MHILIIRARPIRKLFFRLFTIFGNLLYFNFLIWTFCTKMRRRRETGKGRRHIETGNVFEMERGKNKTLSDPIIVVSSDEEDDADVEELFKAFASKVEPLISEEEFILLRLKFRDARSEFVSSANFKKSLRWRTEALAEENAYIFTGSILSLLGFDSRQSQSKSKSSEEISATTDNHVSNIGNEEVTIYSRGEETGQNKNIIHITIDTNEEVKPLEVEAPRPSTSSVVSSRHSKGPTQRNKTERRKISENNHESTRSKLKRELSPRKRKRLLRRLEEKMKHVNERIRILNQAELTLDEMNMNDSTYIQECRLKDRFNQIWNQICRIKGRTAETGRVTEKVVRCPPTGFPEIDRAVNRFLKKKKGRFPDRHDISTVISEAKKKHGLKIAPQGLADITDEVFMYVGNKLQKRRRLDFTNNSGCFLTDDYLTRDDPAMRDPSLLKKLEENKRMSKRALDEVFNKYAHYGRLKNCGNGHQSTSDSESSNQENDFEGKRKKRLSQLSNAGALDSSGGECDDFGL